MDSIEMTRPSEASRRSGERRENTPELTEEDARGSEFHLAPADGGRRAWMLLGAAFVFEAILWGFPLSFGVFQNYYSKQPEFADSRYISVVGTVASGLSYLGAPLITPFIKRFQRLQRQMIWVGWPICILGVVLASFCSSVETLILTQGVAYGLGFLIFYYPILNMVNEYWIARRGMAYGLLCSASGVSGAAMPFLIETLLERYGYQTTLRITAVALLILTAPVIPFLKGRLPPASHSSNPATDWTFVRSPLFWIYTTSNLMQGMGYFFPSLYIPSYAASLGLSNVQGALLLALMSVSQVAGQLTFGLLSDRRISHNLLTIASTVVSAASVLALWGLAHSLPLLIVFVLLYGYFGGGYVAMWARMTTAVSSDPTAAPFIFGLFCFGKGIGNVLTGPIGGNLLDQTVSTEKYGLARYSGIVFFTGTSMVLSALPIGLWRLVRYGQRQV
ncbi:MFS monocarboxylate [Fusarium albosuccineum]|uniref:MFS monocarboxylate n=1 Tax=Fusarium albosuccineum TaxID=1237068 RepID=A0A8H4PFH8_9HYPO|nr:MFS monocarboxylate [Fusarium albosuccineum]